MTRTPVGEQKAVVVRELVEADWAQVSSIIEQVVQAGDTFLLPTDLGETVARKIWLDNGPGGRASAATSGGLVVGTGKMGRNWPGPGAHVATASYMVAQWARGRGVGRGLVVDLLAWAQKAGYAAMQFNAVVDTNRAAIHLYESLGFAVIGTVPRAHQLPTGERMGIMHVEL